MKIIHFIISAILLVFTSCNKEKFPKPNDLSGNWTEQTDNSFKSKLIFENETMYFFKPASTDTLLYRLDDKQELIYLRLKNNSAAGESNHKIFINKRKKELTIKGLYIGINTTETIFKKE